MQHFYLYTIAVFLLALFMVYHEVKRANRKRLFLRIFAVLIASIALLFLIVPLKYESERSIDARTINFLTEGVSISDLQEETYLTCKLELVKQIGKDRVTYVPDLLYHLASNPEISTVNVYGNGLSKHLLKKLDGVKIKFHPADVPAGFTACSWTQILPATEVQRVQGRYNNTGKQDVKLLLEGLGTRLDSIMVPAGKEMSFSLSCTPRQIGPAVFQLHAFAGAEKVVTEEIPFQVVERPKTKILILASFPDFEYKFLRNWLLEHDYSAFFRTRISKDKFSTEQINIEGSESPSITAATLKKYDLVIADDEELASLASLNATLQQEINNGLGLLVRLNEAKSLSGFSKMFNIHGTTDSITTTLVPVLSETGQKLKAVPLNQATYLEANRTQLTLVQDPKGKALVSTALRGSGRITATAIPSTFNWVLNASTANYSSYWTCLIKETARKKTDDFNWNVEPRFTIIGEAVKINFQSSSDSLPVLKVNDKQLRVQQHLTIPFYWQGRFRAASKGWQTFATSGTNAQFKYVYDSNAWTTLRAKQSIEETALYEKLQQKATENSEKVIQKVEKSISRWLFFACLLLSLGFLWFETKILQ